MSDKVNVFDPIQGEELIKVTEYDLLGKLPDPFICDDGSRMDDPAKWEERRKEIYRTAIELHYGEMPPEPEFLEIEPGCVTDYIYTHNYRIITGTKENPVVFTMYVHRPRNLTELPPVVIDGDGCFEHYYEGDYVNSFTSRGVMLVSFNRTELMPDVNYNTRKVGQLSKAYPDYNFGAIGAWAWGYSRCVDALEKLGIADMSCIAFTGHSRGGKTAMLAGALDKRAAIVNPNETCAGACSCYRLHIKAIGENGEEKPSETLKNLLSEFDFWMGEGMAEYADCEEKLPFDTHFLKAMVAPRKLFVSEAASDIWANPVGSWQTTMAAGEVFKFLGVPENLYWYFRSGYHGHKPEDVEMLVNIIKHHQGKEELNDKFYRLPFKQPEYIFDWRAPETK